MCKALFLIQINEKENTRFVLDGKKSPRSQEFVTLLSKSSRNTMSRTALTNLFGTAVSSFYPNYLLKNSPQSVAHQKNFKSLRQIYKGK